MNDYRKLIVAVVLVLFGLALLIGAVVIVSWLLNGGNQAQSVGWWVALVVMAIGGVLIIIKNLVDIVKGVLDIIQKFQKPEPNPEPDSVTPAHAPAVPTEQPDPPEEVIVHIAPTPDGEALRKAYLNWVLETVGNLPLAGIDKATASDPTAQLRLEAVYTALLTETSAVEKEINPKTGELSEPKTRRSLSALEMLNNFKRLVLLGDPGSGKSTFASFVAVCLAGEALGASSANLEVLTAPIPIDEEVGIFGDPEKRILAQPQPWVHGALLPVRIILRDLAAHLPVNRHSPATARDLWGFIQRQLEQAGQAEYFPYLRQELVETGGLVLLDGLDEVPEAETDTRRVQIKQMVEDFAASAPQCRILVTSRTYAYQEQDWRLNGFRETKLAVFSRAQIRQFIERWYAYRAQVSNQAAEDAQGRAVLLKQAIFGNPRLYALAEKPLLLTLMASLHAWRGGNLPEKRAELYAATVELLLDIWENAKVIRNARGETVVLQPSLAEWLGVDKTKVRQCLNEIAYQVHAGQANLNETADIPQATLVNGLLGLSPKKDLRPARLIEYLTQRAGILLPRGVGVYTFPHRTFQEYLAACHLTETDFPDLAASLARQEPERWREALLLAAAKACSGAPLPLWALVEALCPSAPHETERGKRQADLWGGLLAGQALVENADLRRLNAASRKKLERVQVWQLEIMRGREFPALERVLAGEALARLGDPRFDAQHWYLPGDELLGFVRIPAGAFQMGSREGEKDAYDDEHEQHTLELPEYYLGRYPVTVAQFRAFVDASGYSPGEEDRFGGLPSQPVVNVTWHEARAYCDWLDGQLKQIAPGKLAQPGVSADAQAAWGGLAEKRLRVSLPSEAEWENAARGVTTWRYPWGDDFDPDKANTDETGIGRRSVVGCFTGGASPYGIEDLSGNVWEWTRSHYEKYPYPAPGEKRAAREALEAGDETRRVQRGGSFFLNRGGARCAYRSWDNPWLRGPYRGFRAALVP